MSIWLVCFIQALFFLHVLHDSSCENTEECESGLMPSKLSISENSKLVAPISKCNEAEEYTFKLKLNCAVPWCKNKAFVINSTNLCKSNFELKDINLENFVTYYPKASYKKCHKKYPELQTRPGKPGKVSSFSAFCATKNSLGLRWKAPYPPTGKISHYTVSYGVSQSFSHYNQSFDCPFWSNYTCIIISNLLSNTAYKIRVAASNYNVSEEGDGVTKTYSTNSNGDSDFMHNLEIDWQSQNATFKVKKYLEENCFRSIEMTISFRKKIFFLGNATKDYYSGIRSSSTINVKAEDFWKNKRTAADISFQPMKDNSISLIENHNNQPSMVRDFSSFCASNNSLGLKWKAPSRHNFKYTITYGIRAPFSTTENFACQFWDGFICAIIENLKSDSVYKITIWARNDNMKERTSHLTIWHTTISERSGFMKNFKVDWSSYKATFNGAEYLSSNCFKKIEISVSNNKSHEFSLKDAKEDNAFTLTKNSTIRVVAENFSKEKIPIVNITFQQIRKQPFRSDIIKEVCTKTCILQFPPLNSIDNNTEYILLVKEKSNMLCEWDIINDYKTFESKSVETELFVLQLTRKNLVLNNSDSLAIKFSSRNTILILRKANDKIKSHVLIGPPKLKDDGSKFMQDLDLEWSLNGSLIMKWRNSTQTCPPSQVKINITSWTDKKTNSYYFNDFEEETYTIPRMLSLNYTYIINFSAQNFSNQNVTIANATIAQIQTNDTNGPRTLIQFCTENVCILKVPKLNQNNTCKNYKLKLELLKPEARKFADEVETIVQFDNQTNEYLIGKYPYYDFTTAVYLVESKGGVSYAALAIRSLMLILTILIIIALSLIIYYFYQKDPSIFKRFQRRSDHPNNPTIKFTGSRTVRRKMDDPTPAEQESLTASKTSLYENVKKAQLVKIKNLENYIIESFKATPEHNRLEVQFQMVPKSYNRLFSIQGEQTQNSEKNRYKEILPYDDTRVILRGNKHGKDYINASYIKGYNAPRAFIAAQAPLKTTIADFWWMIWQEKVEKIVMMTNLVENGKSKCVQYWPDFQTSIEFGDIAVSTTSSKDFPDYTTRELEIEYRNEKRMVLQYHFTSWPDHNVPLYPEMLSPFIKKLLTFPQKNPTVVHCNAGCGRTGTVILCDIALRMAAKESRVDFLGILSELRRQRIGLVNNSSQYVYAHFVVLDCLFGKNFSISVDENFAEKVITFMRGTTVKPIMEEVDRNLMFFEKINPKGNLTLSDDEKSRNRFSQILPERGHVFLSYSSEDINTYINATKVDTYRCPRKFIVTQQPLPNTVRDFWRLVHDFKVNTVVSLNGLKENDSNCPIFWKQVNVTNPEKNPITLIILEEIDNNVYGIVKIKTTYKDSSRIVNVINLKTWDRETPKPKNIQDILTIYKTAFSFSLKDNSEIIVTCYNGATASGLFVAVNILLEKIKLEQICDVYSAVKLSKQNRAQFIEDWAQYEVLFKIAVEYVKEFDIYNNFTN